MDSNEKTIKASIWYLICNIVRSISTVILTVIMTRLLTKEEYGQFTNFTTWSELLLVLTSLNMANVIMRGKFDFEKKYDQYMSTVCFTNIIVTCLAYFFVMLFKSSFTNLFDLDSLCINLMFVYLLFAPVCDFFAGYQRVLLKYKQATFVAILLSIMGLLFSAIFVFLMKNKYIGRVWGYVLPYFFIGLILYVFFFIKGKKIEIGMIKYTVLLSVPLIPHTLSNAILNASDRIVIKKFCSSEDLAVYGFGYSIAYMITILTTSISQAYTPWLFERLETEEYNNVRKVSKYIALGVLFVMVAVCFILPFAVYIMGGKNYLDALSFLPIIVSGIYIQYVSGFCIGIEHYIKKTYLISVSTMIAAIVNVILNIIFIPKYGYIVAAYTTLLGYVVSFSLHLFYIRRTKYREAVDLFWYIIMIFFSILFSFIFVLVYMNEKFFLICGIVFIIAMFIAFGYLNKKFELFQIIKRYF